MNTINVKLQEFFEKFKNLYQGYLDSEIHDWSMIKQVISFFIEEHKQNTIVDFIDLSNWDSIESYTFDDATQLLELIWHDFSNSQDEFEIECFGAHLIKTELLIDSIYITLNKGLPVLLLKGFYQDKKNLNTKYNQGCSKINFFEDHPFSVQIVKTVKSKIHHITVPKIHCFTVSIVPNYTGYISVDESKIVLYKNNLKLASEKIIDLMKSVGELNERDQEMLQCKGNIARKHFENALKVLNLQQKTKFDKDYQKLMLGDLTTILTNLSFAKDMNFTLQNTIDTLNICSHDAGVFIKKNDVYMTLIFIIAAINYN